jgi:hypothetical protein
MWPATRRAICLMCPSNLSFVGYRGEGNHLPPPPDPLIYWLPARSDTALDVQSELPAQEEILGAQGLGRPKQEQHPPEGRPRRGELAIFRRLTARSWCHGDRPEPVTTARPTGMEHLRGTAVDRWIASGRDRWPSDRGGPKASRSFLGSRGQARKARPGRAEKGGRARVIRRRYFDATARTALGFVLAIASSVRAAPLGCLRPCSHPWSVRTDTPKSAANCD